MFFSYGSVSNQYTTIVQRYEGISYYEQERLYERNVSGNFDVTSDVNSSDYWMDEWSTSSGYESYTSYDEPIYYYDDDDDKQHANNELLVTCDSTFKSIRLTTPAPFWQGISMITESLDCRWHETVMLKVDRFGLEQDEEFFVLKNSSGVALSKCRHGSLKFN